MPEKTNEELSLRDALIGAMSADPVGEGAVGKDVGGVGAEESAPTAAVEPTNTAPVAEEQVPAAAEPTASPAAPAAETPAQMHTNSEMPSQIEMWQAFNQLIAENKRMSEAMQQREAQLNQLNQQLASQNAAMQQQSRAAENNIIGQFTPEAAVPKATTQPQTAAPKLNWTEIGYLSPEEQSERLNQWQNESMAYALREYAGQLREEVAKEIAPIKQDYEAKQKIANNNAALTTLLNMPQFSDMRGKENDLERIIASTPLLQNATNPEQKYMLAALIRRGINSSHQPTTEELVEKVSANPDAMKVLESRRVSEIQQNNSSLPKVVPSSGMGNANAVPEERPKNSEDVKSLMLRRLGIVK
jgi:hypothetical protein